MSDDLTNYWDNLFGVGNDNGGSGYTPPQPLPPPQPVNWDSVFGVANQALNTGADYLYQYPTAPQQPPPQQPTNNWYDAGTQGLLQGAGSIVDWFSKPQPAPAYQDQTPYQLPQPQANPWNFNSSNWYTPPPPPADVATFYGQESTANQSPGSVADFNSIESGYKPSFAAPVDPNALDYNPEAPNASYADWYSKNNPKGIVEAMQKQAAAGLDFSPVFNQAANTLNTIADNRGSPADFYGLESQTQPTQQAPALAPGMVEIIDRDGNVRQVPANSQQAQSQAGSLGNFFNTAFDNLNHTNNPTYVNPNTGLPDTSNSLERPYENISNAVQAGIGASAGILSNLGKATDIVADSGIPIISDIGTGVRNAWEQTVEPAGNFGITSGAAAIGGLGRAAGDIYGNVFNGENNDVGRDITEAIVKQPVVQFGKMLSDPQYFEAMNGYRDQLISQFYQDQLNAGVNPKEAQRLAGRYGVKLANPVTMAEVMGQQEFSNLPPIIQGALMIADPIGNAVYGNIAKPFIEGGKAVAGRLGEAAGANKLGEIIESPQQRGYDAENAVQALVPALADHSNVSGIPLVDLASEFVNSPDFQKALGYVPSKETGQLAGAIGEEINKAAKNLPPNPAPTFSDVVAANRDAYVDYRYTQNLKSGRFKDQVAALKNAEQRTNNLFNGVKKPADLTAVQSAWPGMVQRAGEYLDANDQALTRQKLQQYVTPEYLSEAVNNNLQLQTGAAKINKAGEQVPTRPLEQFGPVAGTVLRGPGAVTNNFLSKLWLNANTGRIVRDSAGNIVKSVLERVNPFGSRKLTTTIDSIGITVPDFSESGLSTEVKKGFGESKAGKAFFTAVNAPGEIPGAILRKGSQIKGNPLNLGHDINSTVQNFESALKGNFYKAKALDNFRQESAASAQDLAKQYGLDPKEVQSLLSDGKLDEHDLRDFADTKVAPGQKGRFIRDVANSRADLRIQARDYGLKATNNAYFSYKKNLIDQTLSGYFMYPYWVTHNMGWLAGYLARDPYKLAAFSTALSSNYERNEKMGVPEQYRNLVLVKKDPDGTLHMWNPASTLPTALPTDALTNAMITITDGEKDYSTTAPKKQNNLGSFLFGSEGKNGARNLGVAPSVLQLNPVLDFFTQKGFVSDALKGLNLTTDNFGMSDKKSLNLFPGGSVYASAAAALGWPLDLLRQAGFKVTDFNPNSFLNSILFPENVNAGKPVAAAERELATQVHNGQLKASEAKLALASIKDGTWNPAALKALRNVQAEGLGPKIISFFGLPTTTLNTPRDQFNNLIHDEYGKVKDDKGSYVTVTKTDPDTGRTYQTKEFQPGKAQAFFDKYPGADVLFASNKSADEIKQGHEDDATRAAIQDLAKKRDDKSISQATYYSELDKLQAANPEYFKAQTQTKLDKASGKTPLLPGESRPEVLTPEQEKARRQYNILSDQYHNLTPGFDVLQAKAYDLKDKGDQAGYQKIVNSAEYRAAVKKQNSFISQNKEWYDQYSKTTQQNTTDRNAELVGGLARTNPALGGKPMNTLEEREFQSMTSDYKNLTDGFEQLQQKAYALKDAGDTAGYKAIVSSPEYKQGQANQLKFIEQNPSWFAQYQASLAKEGFTTKSLADRQYSSKLDEYYSIGSSKFDDLSKQVSDLMNAGDKKGAGKIMSTPEYKAAKAAQQDYLNRNPEFATRFKAEYAAKNGKEMATQAENTYQEKLSTYEGIGGDDFQTASTAQQALRAKGDTKSANAIYLSAGYQDALKAKDQYLKDNPDFAAAYFEKYPSAKTAFDKRQAGRSSKGTSTTGAGSSTTSKTTYTKNYTSTSTKKPYVPYTSSGTYKPKSTYSSAASKYTGSSGGSSSSSTASVPYTQAQKVAYAKALQAKPGNLAYARAAAANALNNPVQPGKTSGPKSTYGGTTTGSAPTNYSVKSYYDAVGKVKTPKASGSEMTGRGWESVLTPADFGINTTAKYWSTYNSAKKAAQASTEQRPDAVHIVVYQSDLGGYTLWSKVKSELTGQDQQLIAALKEYGQTTGTGAGSAASNSTLIKTSAGYIPRTAASSTGQLRSAASLPRPAYQPPPAYTPSYSSPAARKPTTPKAPVVPIHRFLPSPNQSLIRFAGRKRFK
jgi:hypothetical protein